MRDFLPWDLHSGTVVRTFDVPGSVKDAIEACGVPHTEVDLIVVGGRSVNFSHLVRGGDRVAVFPVFESFNIAPIVKVRPEPLRDIRFVAQNLLLEATALGLGAVPVGAFDDDAVSEILGLPNDHEPLYLLPVGHPVV